MAHCCLMPDGKKNVLTYCREMGESVSFVEVRKA